MMLVRGRRAFRIKYFYFDTIVEMFSTKTRGIPGRTLIAFSFQISDSLPIAKQVRNHEEVPHTFANTSPPPKRGKRVNVIVTQISLARAEHHRKYQ